MLTNVSVCNVVCNGREVCYVDECSYMERELKQLLEKLELVWPRDTFWFIVIYYVYYVNELQMGFYPVAIVLVVVIWWQ
jgi:hypothetical protein